jgi:hypothetical protein
MTYSLIIEHSNGDPTYVNNILTWGEVTGYLKHKLDQWTIRVKIYKYSSDNKLLGEKCVTMGNICEVAFTLRDKQALI